MYKRLSPDAEYKKMCQLTADHLFKLLLPALETYGDNELKPVEVWCEAMKNAMRWKDSLLPGQLIEGLERKLTMRFDKFDTTKRSKADARRSAYLVLKTMCVMFFAANDWEREGAYEAHIRALSEALDEYEKRSDIPKVSFKAPEPEHEPTLNWGAGLEEADLTDDEPDIIAELKPIFFGDEEDAKRFHDTIQGMKPKEITGLVNQWVAEGKISDLSKKRPLWSVLYEYGIYQKSEQNWNDQIK